MPSRSGLAALVTILFVGSAAATTQDCPAKSTAMDDVIAALNEATGCDGAMKLFEACEYGTSGDIRFGTVVEKKWEADFLTHLKAPEMLTYRRELRACDRKYQNEDGTMYRSFTAFCRAEAAQRYAHRAQKHAGAAGAR